MLPSGRKSERKSEKVKGPRHYHYVKILSQVTRIQPVNERGHRKSEQRKWLKEQQRQGYSFGSRRQGPN